MSARPAREGGATLEPAWRFQTRPEPPEGASAQANPSPPDLRERRLDALSVRRARRQLLRRRARLDRQPRDQEQQRPQLRPTQQRRPRQGRPAQCSRGSRDQRRTPRRGAAGDPGDDRRPCRGRQHRWAALGRTPSSSGAPRAPASTPASVSRRPPARPSPTRARDRSANGAGAASRPTKSSQASLAGGSTSDLAAGGELTGNVFESRATAGQLDVVVLTSEAGAAEFVNARLGTAPRAYRCAVPASN